LLDETAQQTVVCGLRNGHRDAWTALYDGYSTDLWKYVARLVGSSSGDVADVIQETFLAAAGSARQYDPARGTLWAWLTGIAHHQVSIFWRQAARRSKLLQLAESRAEELQRWIDETDDTIDLWERRELGDLVRATLGTMSRDYAVLLTAKYLDEQSLEEISKREGGSVDAMKSKLARARREFRMKFGRMIRETAFAFDDSKID
jgi:RNA polymerase sigma-70 factor (ECF subfamily)